MHYLNPRTSRAAICLSALTLLLTSACDLDSMKIGDEPTASDGSTSETTGDSESSTDPTGGDEPICEPFEGSTCVSPASACQNPNANCGGYLSRFTAEGCPRPSCIDDNDCLDGERCEQGFSSGFICTEQDGNCNCEGTPDTNGFACVPEELIPEYFCGQFNDENACTNSGFSDDSHRCLWATPSLLATPCEEPVPLAPRCLAGEYHGDGCGVYCDDSLLSWRETDAGLEVFADPLCEYTTIGWEDWSPPPGLNEDEVAC
ncbi:MAG: hypothetical protein ACPG4T_11805, partial [Nannocystaceae bacterium]